MSTSRVWPLAATYSSPRVKSRPISSRIASSISRNSIGARRISTSDSVTIAAVSRLIASIGSSDGANSTSVLICCAPRMRRVVVPMPSISTPRWVRKTHRSWTM